MQTHAGAGLVPNFRLFVGSINTPPGIMFNSQLQSYYECKNDSGGYGQYRQVADHLSLGEEHSDGVLYKGFFSKLESKKKKLVSELHGGLRLPKESRGFVLYEYSSALGALLPKIKPSSGPIKIIRPSRNEDFYLSIRNLKISLLLEHDHRKGKRSRNV